MEINMVKVEVKTLKKSILDQMENTSVWEDSEVVGWVLPPESNIHLIIDRGDRILKVTWMSMCDSLILRDDFPHSVGEGQKYIQDYYHKFPQIFI